MWRGTVIFRVLLAALVAVGGVLTTCAAEEPHAQMAELEATIAELQSRLESLEAQSQPILVPHNDAADDRLPPPMMAPVPLLSHGVTYDGGWVIRPFDPERTPFELKIGLQNQFRHTGFASDEPSVVNSAGRTVPTPSRSDFSINRGRIVFSGYALDPLLEFYANVDYNTVADEQFQILMAWIRHPFHPAFNLAYGLGKVPGTWEWQESARWPLGAERSLATTYFRPSITGGIWADGELSPGWHYHVLVGNGFNTFTLQSSELDDNLAYSGMMWWEPWGDFGQGFSDLEFHDASVLRLGHALTFSRQDGDPGNGPGPEQTAIRLSDGTRLVEVGALAPGATVNQFDITLYAVHAGWKHRGMSFAGEYFLRWLTNIEATQPIPEHSLFDHGFLLQAGAFVVPERLELFTRGSVVHGAFGSGSEISGGVNWYVQGQRNWRFTFDIARIDDSPAQQDRTGFQAGASGLLVRSQVWTSF